MEIKRDIMAALLKWKQRPERKPLIIQGARQIGKTWIMQKFGKEHFDYVAYFNFDASEELCREFENTKSPERLIDILRLYTEYPIEPSRTLIIFDEIQQSNKALNSLKYFCEEAPEYHILAAGSLLGVSLSQGDSFPVGKVEFLQMYPVTFREFLRADTPQMYEFLENLTEIAPLPEIVMGRVGEAYRRYQICGGMPAAVTTMLEKRGVQDVEEIQKSILTAYSLDFAKHAPGKDIPRIAAIWNSIPSQLAKENRKFIYKLVKTGARAREYEDGLLWLEHAGMIYRTFCSSKPGLPLSAYDDLSAFKIYLCDGGLLRVMAQLPADALWSESPLYAEFKGAMAENMVLQSLVAHFDVMPRYWTSEATAEVDFLLQNGISLLPVEVKAGTRLGGKSLSIYIDRFSPELALRYSMNNLKRDGAILNIPIFLADWTKEWLKRI
ncbi:ATP-binding protein [Parabacteroides bouchesdurhonensis]|uniref:ATP-binding protein n=1 Tax=Parabacteroides bouchesdurhonensis TaxID=1936995 RepID=UPI000E49AC69|nr:ATP-binding protein [Parabacteroides bouchesdurhonensis]RHJ92033.1 ATP-binding protein [Bacteroides sp. AM07-16]